MRLTAEETHRAREPHPPLLSDRLPPPAPASSDDPLPLCITADDYGLSPEINEAIEQLAAQGALDAVSVMGHRGAMLGTVNRLLATGVATGVHLVFTGEQPLLDGWGSKTSGTDRLPSGYGRLFARLLLDPRAREVLAREGAAQAQRLRERGLRLDFVNSHEHVHLFPLLWGDAARLAEELGIDTIRAAVDQRIAFAARGLLAASSRLSLSLRPWRGRWVLSPLGVDHACQLRVQTVELLLRRGLRGVRPGTIAELVMHPSVGEGNGGGRRHEYELLASGAIDGLLASRRRLGVSGFVL